MWFDSWSDVLRIAVVGTATYLSLVVLIRMSGKRTLAQMNAFDFVVSVALGSAFATIMLTADVSFVEGLTAIVLLLALQVLVAVGLSRSSGFRRVATASPAVLLTDGVIHDDALRRRRVSREDVLQAVRQSGQGDLASVAAVVLEADGGLSVIPRQDVGDRSALADVRR